MTLKDKLTLRDNYLSRNGCTMYVLIDDYNTVICWKGKDVVISRILSYKDYHKQRHIIKKILSI